MKYGSIPGISKQISRLGQGTATVFDPKNPAACYEMLDLSIEFGINLFDTAQVYGRERSALLGKWIKERNLSDEVVVLAKGAHHGERQRVTPADITTDLEQSLDWLQADHVDLYVLHRDDPSVPVEPIVDILNEHKKAGKIGAFGGSNWSHKRVAAANSYAKEHGLTPFAVSSPNFSLAEMVEEPWTNCVSISGPEGLDARDWYAKSDVALVPWSSLAGGFFSGRYHAEDEKRVNKDRSSLELPLRCYGSKRNFERLVRAEKLGAEKGLQVPQIALAFVMQQPMNVFALISCDGRAQFESNTAVFDINLTEREMQYLDLRSDSSS